VLCDLVRRIGQLERQSTHGAGVSTVFGVTSTRVVQPGFPAELTSSWDSSTGYSAKALTISGLTVTNPDVQSTFTGVVTTDNDTSLTSGTRGWLEPDPQAGGWLFISSGAASSPPNSYPSHQATHNVTGTAVFGTPITVPKGDYLLTAIVGTNFPGVAVYTYEFGMLNEGDTPAASPTTLYMSQTAAGSVNGQVIYTVIHGLVQAEMCDDDGTTPNVDIYVFRHTVLGSAPNSDSVSFLTATRVTQADPL
jgi:hypothetical protein